MSEDHIGNNVVDVEAACSTLLHTTAHALKQPSNTHNTHLGINQCNPLQRATYL